MAAPGSALQESEALYRYAVELSQQIPWVSDPDGNILRIGPGWAQLTDISYEQLLGTGWMRLVHPDDVPRYIKTRRVSLATGEPFQCEYRLQDTDGHYRWYRTRAGAQRDGTGAIVRWYGTIEDIHDRTLAELAHRGHARVLEMAAAGRPLGQVLEGLCHLAEDQLSGARCSILLLDPDQRTLRHGAAPNLPATYNAALEGLIIGPAVGSCGTAAHERRAIIASDIASDPLWENWRDLALSHGLRACWSRPVLARSGDVLGTFAFYYGEPRTPTSSEMARIDTVLHFAALVIERQRKEMELRESEEHYRHSVELNPQIPWAADPQGNIVEASPRWFGVTGMPIEEALGSGWIRVIHPDDVPPTQQRWSHSLSTGEAFDTDYRVRTADGSYRWFRARAAARRHASGAIIRWYGTLEDIHDRRVAEARLHWAAHHDDLTGLPNRRMLHARLKAAVDAAAHTQAIVGLLFIDVDYLKQVNDRFGHDAGDALLQEVARRLCSTTRPADTVARVGGDEFAVVLAEVEGEAEVAAMAEAILAKMREPLRRGGKSLDCRVSIGGAICAGSGPGMREVLKQADLALYHAKADRRGEFKLFTPAMREETRRTQSAFGIARKAVTFGWIEPFYQPKMAPASGQIGGFEALLRWHHPRRGVQSPATIAPAFDDPDLGIVIGERMRFCILRDVRGWLDAGLEFGRIAINTSAVEFRRDDYAERVLEELGWARIPTSCVEVEVTESVFLGSGAEVVERALRTLSAAGVTIALDDFGTGYASLTHLKRFPVDVIKIDQSFVSNLTEDAGDSAIVRGVLGLAGSLGIEVVAEGVETAAQASLLQEYGCRLVQGYHLGRPMPAADVPRFIMSSK
ncbi:EAL domain-containing protein [Microvirga makkahensis]|uniref:EAL domain-containing protein n=1 Tax=Microvirga makkahensis TaxID=1128670 RepID=A0A7X3MWC7_9HYPH|nr:EAL domain-containing protein [Microvirga makkahensis]